MSTGIESSAANRTSENTEVQTPTPVEGTQQRPQNNENTEVQQETTLEDFEKQRPENPESLVYREWLRDYINRLETHLASLGQRSNVAETLPDIKNGSKIRGKKFHEIYSKSVTAKLELFLLSKEKKQSLEAEYSKVEGTFADPKIDTKIREILNLFEFGKEKKGMPTSDLLMKYNGKDRIWVSKIDTQIDFIDSLLKPNNDTNISPLNDEQKTFLDKLRGQLEGIIKMDPLAEKLLEVKREAKKSKGWSKLGIHARGLGLIAVSALALFSFISKKFKIGYSTAAYLAIAYLAAKGMPKGKIKGMVDQFAEVKGQINEFEITSIGTDEKKKIEEEYFKKDPKGWSKISSNLITPDGKKAFRKLENARNKASKTPTKENTKAEKEIEEQFVIDMTGNDNSIASNQFKAMNSEKRIHLCGIFLEVTNKGTKEMMRQYFDNMKKQKAVPQQTVPPPQAPPPVPPQERA